MIPIFKYLVIGEKRAYLWLLIAADLMCIPRIVEWTAPLIMDKKLNPHEQAAHARRMKNLIN
jgi:hypothetical protein